VKAERLVNQIEEIVINEMMKSLSLCFNYTLCCQVMKLTLDRAQIFRLEDVAGFTPVASRSNITALAC
jgi:hypothetical protein